MLHDDRIQGAQVSMHEMQDLAQFVDVGGGEKIGSLLLLI